MALSTGASKDDVIHRHAARLVTYPHPGGRVPLRIEVDDEDPEAELGEGRPEADGSG